MVVNAEASSKLQNECTVEGLIRKDAETCSSQHIAHSVFFGMYFHLHLFNGLPVVEEAGNIFEYL